MRFGPVHRTNAICSAQARNLWFIAMAACAVLVIPPVFGQVSPTSDSSAPQADEALSPGLAAASLGEDSAEAGPLNRTQPRALNPGAEPAGAAAAAAKASPGGAPVSTTAAPLAASGKPPGALTSAAAGKPGTPPGADALSASPAPEPRSTVGGAAGPASTLSSECDDLLKLATTLKAEVDKTTKDELSVAVIVDAGRIELLARKIREDPK